MGEDRLKVLVTGATGFLGGNIVKALAARPDVTVIAACRAPSKLPAGFDGEVRAGDMMDSQYRRAVVKDVQVICNASSWASLWGHRQLERERFFEPMRDLIEQSIGQGVRRFIQTSTVAIADAKQRRETLDDFAKTGYTGFWPHLDCLVDLDHYMIANSDRGMEMVTMRLGHFVGAGNALGILPALTPRLRTYLVPWLAGGRKHVPLVADVDLGKGFALAATARGLSSYESFNICGAEFPTLREVIDFIASETGFPKPIYSVPYPAGYAFGWLMEALNPILPGQPFLTRSIVHLCENWVCPNDYAGKKIGYSPTKTWKVAVREHLADLRKKGYPWPRLCQAV